MQQISLAKTRRGLLLSPIVAVALGVSGHVSAQQTINLTAIDGYPIRAMWVKEFSEFFIPQVNKRLAAGGKYKIRWNQAYGGQIVKPRGVLEGIQRGLGDIGVVTTPFHTDKVPMQALPYVTPFVSSNPALVASTMDRLAQELPEIPGEFKLYGQVYLATACALDSYQLFTKMPVKELTDLKGRKIAGAGTNLRYLEPVGATGVAGPLTGFYNKMQTGVVDGSMLWAEAAVRFKFPEVAPYMLVADLGAVNTKVISVNSATWQKLPPEVKKVLQEVAIAYRDHLAKLSVEQGKAAVAAYKKRGTVTVMSDAARTAWANSLPNLAVEWATSINTQGKPGTRMLKAYMNALRAAGEKPLRHWDR